jgi:O-antigen/teichoic acid export membrane protein
VFDRFLTLGKQAFVYGLGGAALQVVGLVTLPVFTRVFSTPQFGVLETMMAGFSALLVLADLGLTSAAQRSYYDYDAHQGSERRAALATGLSMTLLFAVTAATLVVIFAGPISTWQFNTDRYANLVRVVAVTVPLTVLATYFREVMRLKLQPWAYTVSAITGSVGAAGFGITAVLAFHSGLEGVLLGVLAGNAIAAVFGFLVVRPDVIGRFSRPELRRMIAYGLPLVPASVALWGVNLLDRVLLTKITGNTVESAQYAVANRFASLLMFAVTAFTLAFGPFQLALWREDPELEKQVRSRVLTYVTVGLVALGVLLSLFARELASVVAPREGRAYEAVGLLTMSVAAYGVSSVVLFGIGITRRTGYIAIYTVAALVLNVGLNIVLIPPIGMVGSAVATLAAYALLAAFYYHRSQVLYPTPYELPKTLTALVLGALAMVVGVIRFDSLGVALAVKAATALAFVAALVLLRVIDTDDLLGLRTAARIPRRRGGPA